MKTPPFLLFAALLFWGWESDPGLYGRYTVIGALAGALLELSRIWKVRWELEDVDFNRIWSFCALAIVALAGYIFSTNEQGGGISGMMDGAAGLRNAQVSSTVATTSVLRWLPLIFFPFVLAQVYNTRPTVPLTAVSMVLRLRRRRGEHALAGRYLDISYSYFIVCVFSAGIHTNQQTHGYFWGQVVLLLWVLWTLRSARFGFKSWLVGLAAVVILGFIGQAGIGQFERVVQNFNAQWLARFFQNRVDPSQSITAMGQIGDLKLSPRIVIRLEPGQVGVAPNYLREATYRYYSPNNQSWQVGQNNAFGLVQPQPDNSTWILQPARTNHDTVRIACYLYGRSNDGDPEGVLPLPSGTSRLENLPYVTSVIALQTNQMGVVLVSGSGLMIFDARYGAGPTFDSPPDFGTNLVDFYVPTNEVPALDQVIAEMNLTNNIDLEKRVAVETFFAHKFTYSTWQGPVKRSATNASPLTRFLLTSRTGHCEYFATATVLLMRRLGIPARYAVGYSVHEASGSGYVVRERDAHAWCLVWNRDAQMWEDFDTTPASWVAIEGAGASVLDALSDVRSWLGFQFSKLRWRQAHLRQYIVWTLSPVMMVLLYYIIFQRRAKKHAAGKKLSAAPVVWPGHDSAFYQLEKALAARGLPRQPQEPLSEWLERVLAEPALIDLQVPLRELLHLHYRYRFDPNGLTEGEKTSLVQNAGSVLATLGRK